MTGTRYTENHEWVRLDEDGSATVGITDHAQEQLGDLVYIELPEVGQDLEQGDEAAVIESVKSASEIKSPMGGNVTAVNEALAEDPTLANSDAAGEGWFYRLATANPDEFESLLDADAYAALID